MGLRALSAYALVVLVAVVAAATDVLHQREWLLGFLFLVGMVALVTSTSLRRRPAPAPPGDRSETFDTSRR